MARCPILLARGKSKISLRKARVPKFGLNPTVEVRDVRDKPGPLRPADEPNALATPKVGGLAFAEASFL